MELQLPKIKLKSWITLPPTTKDCLLDVLPNNLCNFNFNKGCDLLALDLSYPRFSPHDHIQGHPCPSIDNSCVKHNMP